MRWMARRAMTTALLAGLTAAPLGAQARVVLGVGGGLISPTKGDHSFGDGVKSFGYHVQAILGIAPGSGRATVRFDGQYGSVNYRKLNAAVQPKVRLFVVNADLVLHPRTTSGVRPYLMVGPTFGHFNYRSGVSSLEDESATQPGFNGGVGLNIGRSERIWWFLEGRYVYTSDHQYLPLTGGVRISLRQPYTKP